MKIEFSKAWKSSKSPRKQRKYTYNAPLHIKSKMLGSHLSKELKQKYNKRSMRPITGDKVKVMIGTYKGKIGKIERIIVKDQKVMITGIDMIKKDGNKVLYPIHASNVQIIELNLTDKKRKKILDKSNKGKENKNDKKTSQKTDNA